MSNTGDLQRMREFGAWEEKTKMLAILVELDFIWMGDKQILQIDKRELIEKLTAKEAKE